MRAAISQSVWFVFWLGIGASACTSGADTPGAGDTCPDAIAAVAACYPEPVENLQCTDNLLRAAEAAKNDCQSIQNVKADSPFAFKGCSRGSYRCAEVFCCRESPLQSQPPHASGSYWE